VFAAAVAAGVAAALVLAGCGGSGATATPNGVEKLPADQILSKSLAAAEKAKSVRVSGTAPGGSRLDLAMSADTTRALVTSGGATLEVLHVNQAYYLKAGKDFWAGHVGAASAAALADKYVKVGSGVATQFKQFTDIASLFGSLKPTGTLSKGNTKTVNGTPSVELLDSKDTSVLYVSTVGEPYPVEINQPGANGGTITFTDWNKPISVTVPPKSQVVDLTSVTG